MVGMNAVSLESNGTEMSKALCPTFFTVSMRNEIRETNNKIFKENLETRNKIFAESQEIKSEIRKTKWN